MRATSWISGHGSERHASSTATPPKPARSSALATEVGFNDPLVRLDDARQPFRDLLAVVENEHGLAEAHDHLHVVLDEQHGLARVAQPAHRLQPLDPGDAVEERRLARAVGADEAVDARRLQRQRDVVDGGHAAEALAYPLDREHGRHRYAPGRFAYSRYPSRVTTTS